MDSESGTITRWLGELKAGEAAAVQPLWDRYFARLVGHARARLLALRTPTAAADGEDVALSAFDSLCEGVRVGRFPQLADRSDLWRVLVHLAACKAVDHHRKEARLKRGGGRAQASDPLTIDNLVGPEPTPEFAAIVAEEYLGRLDMLGDATLRRIAELKLACHTNQEIADLLGCSLRTVTLKLDLIRKKWQRPESPT